MISLGAGSIPDAKDTMFRCEPVVGSLTIRAKKGLKLYKRDGAPVRIEIPATHVDGCYRTELEWDIDTYWLFVR